MSLKHYRGYPTRNIQSDPESDIQEYSDFEDLDQECEEESDEEEEEEDEEVEEEEDPALQLPYPGFIPVSLKYLDQTSRPRSWCLRMITNPYPLSDKNRNETHNPEPSKVKEPRIIRLAD